MSMMTTYTDNDLEHMLSDIESDHVERKESFKWSNVHSHIRCQHCNS